MVKLCWLTHLVEVGTVQVAVAVALRHGPVESGLHVFELQHAVLQAGLAALPVLTRTKQASRPRGLCQGGRRAGLPPPACRH